LESFSKKELIGLLRQFVGLRGWWSLGSICVLEVETKANAPFFLPMRACTERCDLDRRKQKTRGTEGSSVYEAVHPWLAEQGRQDLLLIHL